MRIIGLTGGIGSGKSTVAQFLAELGAAILDLDKIGHEAISSGTESWHSFTDKAMVSCSLRALPCCHRPARDGGCWASW